PLQPRPRLPARRQEGRGQGPVPGLPQVRHHQPLVQGRPHRARHAVDRRDPHHTTTFRCVRREGANLIGASRPRSAGRSAIRQPRSPPLRSCVAQAFWSKDVGAVRSGSVIETSARRGNEMIERNGLVGLVALALASSGSLACGGDDVASSISGVIPGEVFVGRSAEVLIVGNNTSWSEGVSVSFGEGVTIGDTTVASPTALMVSVTADETATLGTRDVVVTQDGEELAFAGAFELSSPVKIASVQGQIAQGSISVIKVQNLDFANPFDTTTTGDGLFTPIEYVNVQVHAGNADALIQYVEPYTMEILLLT